MKTAILIFAMFGTLGAMLDLFNVQAIISKVTARFERVTWTDAVMSIPMIGAIVYATLTR